MVILDKSSQFKNNKTIYLRVPNVLLKPSKRSKSIIITAVPGHWAGRSPREERLLSGFLSDFLVDHMAVPPVADWLLLPTNNAEEDDDDEEEQTSGHRQTDDHLFISPS